MKMPKSRFSKSGLLLVFYEVEERIDDINVAARSCKGVRLRFMNQVELEGMVISGLCGLNNRISYWLQLIVQRRRFDDFPFYLQFVEDLLPRLHFLVLIPFLSPSAGWHPRTSNRAP